MEQLSLISLWLLPSSPRSYWVHKPWTKQIQQVQHELIIFPKLTFASEFPVQIMALLITKMGFPGGAVVQNLPM